MNIKVSIVARYLQKSYEAQRRIIAMQGGTRSGKTYNILCWLIVQCLTNWTGKTISVVRQALPALKATSERDFFEILEFLGIYTESDHNKTDRLYKLHGNVFEFFSCDENQKVRGRKRDVLFCNEANELQESTYKQLAFRTKEFIIMDYNPSAEEHWIYDKILTDKRTDFYKTTYKDNPFLEKAIIEEIESLRGVDDTLWQIFGLGERGFSTAKIYTHISKCDFIPEGETFIGIDFGYNNATAVVQVTVKDDVYYVKELMYETKKTNGDLITLLKSFEFPKNTIIFADSAEPNRIEELRREGFNVTPAKKDVKAGIDYCKAKKIFIHQDSFNLEKEAKAYKWKEVNSKVLDEPVKFLDHALDAMRYAIYTHAMDKPQSIIVSTKNVRSKNTRRNF